MGLLDAVTGDTLGRDTASSMGGALAGLLGGSGQAGGSTSQGSGSAIGGMGNGLGGLMSSFEQAGLGHIAQSWVGNGPNQSVSPDQLQSVLGDDKVQSMAGQAGMQPQDFLSQLSQHLPNAVHAMTPDGQVPDGSSGSL